MPGESKNYRVLIVDDDALVRSAIGRMLHNLHGDHFEFNTAPDGVEADRAVEVLQPDLIILDLKMPGRDGFEVCRHLKENPKTRNIQILAVSGTIRREDYHKILEAGADAFLEKPFSEKNLKERVSGLLHPEENHD